MKTNKIFNCIIAVAFMLSAANVSAQNDDKGSLINVLRLEARADVEYSHHYLSDPVAGNTKFDSVGNYDIRGRYFNLHLGGNLGGGFSFYIRQRIVANPGSVSFFDNTDFLYINYRANKNWSFRLGKDALAIGGYEYDAPPIDVLFNGYYWDNIYCFQLAASATYHFTNENHLLTLQAGVSPYSYSGSPYGSSSLIAYNLYWAGNMGHFHTVYSIGLLERARGTFMSYIALGNKLVYDKWDLYLDLLHHGNSTSQLTKNWGLVSCGNYYFSPEFSVFAKGGYHQNMDEDEMLACPSGTLPWDCLSIPGMKYYFYGVGLEYRPAVCHDVRIHAFLANYKNLVHATPTSTNDPTLGNLRVNVGVTWNINVLKLIAKLK